MKLELIKRMRHSRSILALLLLVVLSCGSGFGQKKSKKPAKSEPTPATELAKLRDDYVNATKDYKASLQKLLEIYEGNVKKAEEKLATTKKLLDEGLVSKVQVEEQQHAV